MTVMDKGRDLECVPLLHAVDKIRTRCCNGDLAKAREIVKDLDIRILRPDGTQARLRAVANLWDNPDLWEELFRTGLFDAPARRPRWRIQDRRSMRRVQPDERCSVVVTCESLDSFLKRQPSRAGRGEEYNWEGARIYLMDELKDRGSPRDPQNQVEGWRSDSDAAGLVIEHFLGLDKDGSKAPGDSTTRKKVTVWIDEFEQSKSAHN